MALTMSKMDTKKSELGTRRRWDFSFTSVVEDLKREAKKRGVNQQDAWDVLKRCGRQERGSESSANVLEWDALSKALDHDDAKLLNTDARRQIEGRKVSCEKVKARAVNERLQSRESQSSQSTQELQDRERSQGESSGMCLLTGPKVVLQGNLVNVYDIEYLEEERHCLTRLTSVQEVDIHVMLPEGRDWTADDFLLKCGPVGYIGDRQDTKLSTTSGATTPTQSVRGVSSYIGNGDISRISTPWDGSEGEDVNGNSTWGTEFFLLEQASIPSNGQYQNSAGKFTCAENDLPYGWAQAVDFTEMLLQNSLEEKIEERGSGREINSTDERYPVLTDIDQQKKNTPFLASNQEQYPSCHAEHYESFLRDTDLIETILGGFATV